MRSNEENEMIRCLLCDSDNHKFFSRDKLRTYRRCNGCSLLFVPPEFHISRESEWARYEEHNNDPNDAGYRDFLERIVEPVKKRIEPGVRGLDFGCGPTPLLSELFSGHGFPMETYDPFYNTDKSTLNAKYGFIVSTEVIEHLSKPLEVFGKLLSMLKPGGILAVMTRLYDDSIDFRGWHYKNDATHICFYSIETFDWLSEYLGARYTRVESDIFVFEEKEGLPTKHTKIHEKREGKSKKAKCES